MKEKNNKIGQFITTNKVILILFTIYIAFHSFFEKHISTLLVNTFLSYLTPTLVNDCFAIISGLFIIYRFVRLKKLNSYISNQIFILSLLFFVIILYYRFFDNTWIFTSMFIYDKVKYIDIIYIYCLSNIVVRILYKKKRYSCDKEKGFLFDNPIQTENDDKLNRNNIAKTLVERIQNTVSSDAAFAIGICSEWGQGKTSFLNLIKKKLDNENRIIVQFNPWLNNDENSIITSFFDELSEELKEYNKELSDDLIKYAEILNTTENNIIERTLNLFKTNHSNNLRKKFESINHEIKKSGKQIVIFIDDLDRLYEKEILEVLRLIRNSANFTNTIFIAAYDRNYLISALKKANEYRPNFYLEKIFQLEMMLPKFEKYIIANELKTAIKPFLNDKDKEILEELLKNGYHRRFTYFLFSNIRDINRFVNSFLLSYELLEGEIDLLDLLNLELLRIRYLGIYNLLSKDYNDFLGVYGNDKNSYLHLKNLRDKDDNKKSLGLEKTAL
jgi:type II secretory pathway predicted ATPase ExeA